MESEGEEEGEVEGGEEGGERSLWGNGHSTNVTLPYVAQENLELLTVELVDRCLDSSFKGGDLLGQHPETGEDVS